MVAFCHGKLGFGHARPCMHVSLDEHPGTFKETVSAPSVVAEPHIWTLTFSLGNDLFQTATYFKPAKCW